MPYTPPAGDAVDLIFSGAYVPPAGDAVTLNFQATASNTVTLSVLLDDASGLIEIVAGKPPVAVTLQATLDDAVGDVELAWSAGVFRGITKAVRVAHQGYETHLELSIGSGIRQAQKTRAGHRPRWQTAQAMTAATGDGWGVVPNYRKAFVPQWAIAEALAHTSGGVHRELPHKPLQTCGAWVFALPIGKASGGGYKSPPRRAFQPEMTIQAATVTVLVCRGLFGVATATHRQPNRLPWEPGNPHSWLWGGWFYPPPEPPPPYTPTTELVFYQKIEDYTGGAILEFNRPCWAWPLTNQRIKKYQGVVIVLHTVKVTRLPDLANVPALTASLKFDIDSWAWGVTVNLQTPSAMALLEPVNGEPRQVRIELDGIYVTALIEQYGERRGFGSTMYTATGRSTLALLAQPFAPVRSYLETAQKTAAQLIDQELVNTGWSVAYHADLVQLFTTDWLVPAGAWSYQGKTPVEAIMQIAQAVGARAYADRTAAIVHIAPRYPVSPWNWASAAPDNTLPISMARDISTQLSAMPEYNQVYVSGQNQGVLVSAVRQGTAGDRPAPMVTDPLMTHVQAGRERARNIFANTGRQARVTLDLPLNTETGLVEVGSLVVVGDTVPWRGQVTGIGINAAHGAIAQQVEIERHYP